MVNIILWVYVALVCVGGFIGYLKAGSIISLVTSVAFAIPLALCALNILPKWVAYALTGLLGLFFAYRLFETGKFMPAGMMMVLSIIVLILIILL